MTQVLDLCKDKQTTSCKRSPASGLHYVIEPRLIIIADTHPRRSHTESSDTKMRLDAYLLSSKTDSRPEKVNT